MMNAKERLKEQRKKGWFSIGASFGLGVGSGVGLSLSSCAAASGFWPVWAAMLVSFALGGVTVLAYWWLASKTKPMPQCRRPDKPDH
jgi:4-hydroxybenzoate polyprenyltransferase